MFFGFVGVFFIIWVAVYHFVDWRKKCQSISNGLIFFLIASLFKTPQIFKFPKMHSNGTHDFIIVKKLRR